MKKFVAFCLLLITPVMLSAQREDGNLEPKTVKLERGQVLDLSLLTPFDSGRAHTGDEILFKLERALKADQLTVLPKNWLIHGRISEVTRAGNWNCKHGRVRWKLKSVTAPDGRRIKVQSIATYLAKPSGAEVVDRVPLDTTGQKIDRATKYVAMAPIFVLYSPVIILMVIGMVIASEEDCPGHPGVEESVLGGAHFYFAVSEDMRLVQTSSVPHRCDTPETVTDSPMPSTHCE
jgi:hypothetical protein